MICSPFQKKTLGLHFVNEIIYATFRNFTKFKMLSFMNSFLVFGISLARSRRIRTRKRKREMKIWFIDNPLITKQSELVLCVGPHLVYVLQERNICNYTTESCFSREGLKFKRFGNVFACPHWMALTKWPPRVASGHLDGLVFAWNLTNIIVSFPKLPNLVIMSSFPSPVSLRCKLRCASRGSRV